MVSYGSPLLSRSLLSLVAAMSLVALSGCGGDDLGEVNLSEVSPSAATTTAAKDAGAAPGAAVDVEGSDAGDADAAAQSAKDAAKPKDSDGTAAGEGSPGTAVDVGAEGSSLKDGDGGFLKKETSYGKDQGVTIPVPGDGTAPTSVKFQSGDRAVEVSDATAELCEVTDDFVNGRFVKGDYAITVSAEKDAGGLVSVSGDKRFEGVAENVEVDAGAKTFKVSGKSADGKMSYAFSGTC